MSTTAMTLGPDKGTDEWGYFFIFADASGGEDIVPAPGTGLYLYIDEFYLNSTGDTTVDIGSAQGTGVTTILLGPMGTVDGSQIGPLNMHGQRLVTNTTFAIDTSAAVPIAGYVKGHTGPAFTYTKDL